MPVFVAALATAALPLFAQQPQLTLADLLIGLRSKKVTLEERNRILAEAVRDRGVTFAMTTEIEKELAATGASVALLDAVRARSVPAPTPTPTPVAVATPAPTPIPTPMPTLDFNFYRTRADGNLKKGDFSQAVADYDKAVVLKADEPIAFLNRGLAHYNLNDLTKAGADFDRSIALDPKDGAAYLNRGLVNEKLGELEKAADDFKKAAELSPTSEEAKAGAKRVSDVLAARAAAAKKPSVPEAPAKAPESINLGTLTAANAIRMVKPIYNPLAIKSNIEGRVVVEVSMDDQGNVTEAKAVSGPQFLRGSAEDAARRSKFKPAMFGSQPIKSTGTITYFFSLKENRE